MELFRSYESYDHEAWNFINIFDMVTTVKEILKEIQKRFAKGDRSN